MLYRSQQNQEASNPAWYLFLFSCVQPRGAGASDSIRAGVAQGVWGVLPLISGACWKPERAWTEWLWQHPLKAACAGTESSPWVLQRLWSLNVAIAGVCVEGAEIHWHDAVETAFISHSWLDSAPHWGSKALIHGLNWWIAEQHVLGLNSIILALDTPMYLQDLRRWVLVEHSVYICVFHLKFELAGVSFAI